MYVSHLSLTSWRNYEHVDLQFTPGITVFIGRNGQGKTNLVEAIGYFSTLGSHRTSVNSALIKKDHDDAVIRAKFVNSDREVLVECQLFRDKANVAQINRNPARPREITNYCHSVLFAPEDLSIVRGDPGERRKFIDSVLVQLSPRFAGVMSDYERVVKQRNNLLKTSRGVSNVSTLEIWNDKLVEFGSELIRARADLVAQLRPFVAAAYRDIVTVDHQPGLEWNLSWSAPVEEPIEDRFRAALTEVAAAERERGVTLVGPHRDELELELNGLPVKGYASHGESWSFVLALKLAAANVLRERSLVGDPIVILDDVFAELDHGRRERLAEAIGSYEQVLITAAVAEDVPHALMARSVSIHAGQLVTENVADD